MNIINKEYFQNRSYEGDIIKNIGKRTVYTTLRKNNFDPESLLYLKKFTCKKIRLFNSALRKTSMELNIKVHEIIIFLDEDFGNIDSMMDIFDEKNKDIMRSEMSKAYNISDEDCILFRILS